MPNDENIYREPTVDPDTLANLGPLRAMAGTWIGEVGVDIHPTEHGPEENHFVEHYDAQPIDPQTNGPQLFYGLRYHTRLVRAEERLTFHEQVGHWLWEPKTQTVYLTLSIPRGQVALASGPADADLKSFTVRATQGTETSGILSNPFLYQNFSTTLFEMSVTAGTDGTWSYTESTTLQVRGVPTPFLHTDRNTLRLVTPPRRNPYFE